METLLQTPRTLMDVYDLLPEGTLAELIDNRLFMSPAPTFQHQKLLKKIAKKLDSIVEDTDRGTVIIAPFDVKLDAVQNVVQPDILVILKSNPNQVNKDGKYFGVPDLIVEVLSEGNKDHDLVVKKNLYEKFGVQEYFVVDPQTRLCIGFTLASKQYEKSFEAIGKLSSALLKADFLF